MHVYIRVNYKGAFMKHAKITSVLLSIAVFTSIFAAPVCVLADETSAPSDTQSTESVETKETDADEEKVKHTNKNEIESQPSFAEDTESSKENEVSTSKPSVTESSKETEKSVPSEKPTKNSKKTAVAEERIPSQSVSKQKKNASSGYCGDNLTWRVSGTTLYISGSGKMWDFSDYVPWHTAPAGWLSPCKSHFVRFLCFPRIFSSSQVGKNNPAPW